MHLCANMYVVPSGTISSFTCFEKKTQPFDNIARWNTLNAFQGKSYLWHEKYSLPYTSVFGFVKTLGFGSCEQNWAAVKNTKTGKSVHWRIGQCFKHQPFSVMQESRRK